MFAGPEARLERSVEEVGEVALGELGTDVGAVACFLEQVCVGVEGVGFANSGGVVFMDQSAEEVTAT